MRNEMLSMKDDSGVIFINDKSRNIGDLMHDVCSCIGGYPYSIMSVRVHTPKGRGTIVMFFIVLLWRLLVLTGVRPNELPEYARSTRKVAQRCANWLVSPFLHVWAVCRVYGTHPNYPLGQHRRKIHWKIGPIISFACDCCITPIGGHLLSILEILKPRAITFSDKDKAPMWDRGQHHTSWDRCTCIG